MSSFEGAYDFRGAGFRLDQPKDREVLGWVLNQFLYGEVTGIQCGLWLYRAPHLSAAQFIARQASEELSHVKRIARIMEKLGVTPGSAHPAIRFLATGMVGHTWGQHVALEMALGEALVLQVFYALHDTLSDDEIRKILASAIEDEKKHVAFGEVETRRWLQEHPGDRRLLLAAALIQEVVLRRLRGFVVGRVVDRWGEEHPVLGQFQTFYDHCLDDFSRRVHGLGISRVPLRDLGFLKRLFLVFYYPLGLLKVRFRRRRLLTDHYLRDPWFQGRGDGRRP